MKCNDKLIQDNVLPGQLQVLVAVGVQRAASPVPEREVSSHPPLLPAAAGGTREKWKALSLKRNVVKCR